MSLFDATGKRITKINELSTENILAIATHLPAAIEELVQFKTLLLVLFEKSFNNIDTSILPEWMQEDIPNWLKLLKTPDISANLIAWSKMEEGARVADAAGAYTEYYNTIRALAKFEHDNCYHPYCQRHPMVLTAISGFIYEGPQYTRTAAALIESGTQFHQKSTLMGTDMTALERAIELEHYEIVKLMLEHRPKNVAPSIPDEFDIARDRATKNRDAAAVAILSSPVTHTARPLQMLSISVAAPAGSTTAVHAAKRLRINPEL